MAKKKKGFGRFLGAITGTPYERLLKQIDKLVDQVEDEDELAQQLEAMVDEVGDAYEEESIESIAGMPSQVAPSAPEAASDATIPDEAPPLPEGGLPDGWTADQWRWYGHEWLAKYGDN